MDLQDNSSRALEQCGCKDRQTLCRADLGVHGRQQGGSRSDGAPPCPGPERHSVVAAKRDIQLWKCIRRLRWDTKYSARPHEWRQGSRTDLLPGPGRETDAAAVQGHVLLL